MYLHLNQGRWYPWKRIAQYGAFLKRDQCSEKWSLLQSGTAEWNWIFETIQDVFFCRHQGSRKRQKIKIVGRDQEPLINLLIQNIFLQPKLIIRVLTNWSQSFNGISGFLGFEGWVPRKPCLDVFLLQIYFWNLQIASKMRDADSHHHAPVIAKETSFFFVR